MSSSVDFTDLRSVTSKDDFKKINELIEGYVNTDNGNLALANRPLPSVKQCPCLKEGRNDLTKVKPYYNNGEFQQSIGNAPGVMPLYSLTTSYDDRSNSDKEIPVIIKKNRDQYLVLVNKTDDNVYVDSWADLPKTQKKESKTPKMDWVTQFYTGSISVVALFIVFRMIQKTK